MFKVSIIIEDDIIEFWETYGISDKILLHELRVEDRVASSPTSIPTLYKEDYMRASDSLYIH